MRKWSAQFLFYHVQRLVRLGISMHTINYSTAAFQKTSIRERDWLVWKWKHLASTQQGRMLFGSEIGQDSQPLQHQEAKVANSRFETR